MSKVIGTAKHNYHIRIRDHRIHPGGIEAVNFTFGQVPLRCDTGTADTVTIALSAGTPGQNIPECILYRSGAAAFRNAVTQKSDVRSP